MAIAEFYELSEEVGHGRAKKNALALPLAKDVKPRLATNSVESFTRRIDQASVRT